MTKRNSPKDIDVVLLTGRAEAQGDDADARAHWRKLISHELPAAALNRPDWPIRLDHCFARVVLDVVHGRPWREAIAAPAWRNMTSQSLREATALGEDILTGRADLRALNARSLALRGKRAR